MHNDDLLDTTMFTFIKSTLTPRINLRDWLHIVAHLTRAPTVVEGLCLYHGRLTIQMANALTAQPVSLTHQVSPTALSTDAAD